MQTKQHPRHECTYRVILRDQNQPDSSNRFRRSSPDRTLQYIGNAQNAAQCVVVGCPAGKASGITPRVQNSDNRLSLNADRRTLLWRGTRRGSAAQLTSKKMLLRERGNWEERGSTERRRSCPAGNLKLCQTQLQGREPQIVQTLSLAGRAREAGLRRE